MKNKKDEMIRHTDCKIVRGIKFFKCISCKEQSANYVNGINLCNSCCERMGVCVICGSFIKKEDDRA